MEGVIIFRKLLLSIITVKSHPEEKVDYGHSEGFLILNWRRSEAFLIHVLIYFFCWPIGLRKRFLFDALNKKMSVVFLIWQWRQGPFKFFCPVKKYLTIDMDYIRLIRDYDQQRTDRGMIDRSILIGLSVLSAFQPVPSWRIELFQIAFIVDEVMRCFRVRVRSCRGAGKLAPSEGVFHGVGDIPGWR